MSFSSLVKSGAESSGFLKTTLEGMKKCGFFQASAKKLENIDRIAMSISFPVNGLPAPNLSPERSRYFHNLFTNIEPLLDKEFTFIF
jgi:hypothetical protein